MTERGLGDPQNNPKMAERAALMTRVHKRDVDKGALREHWKQQAAAMGFDPGKTIAQAREAAEKLVSGAPAKGAGGKRPGVAQPPERVPDSELPAAGESPRAAEAPPAGPPTPEEIGRAKDAVEWAAAHLSEREAVFTRTDLLTAALASGPGAVSVVAAEQAIGTLEKSGRLHRAPALESGDGMTTDRALADEREMIGLMENGQERGRVIMRGWVAQTRLHKGPLTDGQKQAVKLILSAKDRVVGIQGYGREACGRPTSACRAWWTSRTGSPSRWFWSRWRAPGARGAAPTRSASCSAACSGNWSRPAASAARSSW